MYITRAKGRALALCGWTDSKRKRGPISTLFDLLAGTYTRVIDVY